MGVSDALCELGGFLEACEAYGEVTDVALVTDGDEQAVSVDVSLSLPLDPDDGETGLRATEVTGDGSLRLTLGSSDPMLPVADRDVTVETTATEVGDGVVTVSLSVSAATSVAATASVTADAVGRPQSASDDDAEIGDESGDDATARERDVDEQDPAGDDTATVADPIAAARDDDVPPFRNPELLAAVYDACDTFGEMADELEMDVTAETVRRYMVDYDIHEPNSYDTGDSDQSETAEPQPPTAEQTPAAPDDGETPVVLADGIGLPDDVTAETLIEIVRRSNTIYEVKREMGVKRDDALEVLRDLNLLDLVVGRLATEADREIDRDEIIERLQQASAD